MGRYVHHIPGRIRVRCATMRSNPHKLQTVSEALRELPGVQDIRVNVAGGSIIVLYDTERCDRDALLAAVDAKDCVVQTPAGELAAMSGGVGTLLGDTVRKTVMNAVVGTVVKATVEPPVLSLVRAARVFR